jgi:hypothetical protein
MAKTIEIFDENFFFDYLSASGIVLNAEYPSESDLQYLTNQCDLGHVNCRLRYITWPLYRGKSIMMSKHHSDQKLTSYKK